MRSRRKKKQLVRNKAKMVGGLVLSLSIITGCTIIDSIKPAQKAVEQGPQLRTVKVEKVSKQLIAKPVEITAEVQSSLQMELVAQTGGIVEQLLKKRGETVREGEVIARLSSTNAKLERDRALLAFKSAEDAVKAAVKEQAELRRENSNSVKRMEMELEASTRNVNKMKNDYDAGLVTKNELREAERQLELLRMDVELAKRQAAQNTDNLSGLKLQLNSAQIALQEADKALLHLEVKSPLNGILTELPYVAGMEVQSGGVLGQVVKVDPVKITAFLSEEASNLVRGKSELFYYLAGNEQKKKAAISLLSSVADPETKAYELNLEVPNHDTVLKPGMKVRLQLTDEAEQTVAAVPQFTVITEDEEQFVFVLVGEVVEKRRIQVGRSNDIYYEVISGVSESELVVTDYIGLKDKEKVVIQDNVQ